MRVASRCTRTTTAVLPTRSKGWAPECPPRNSSSSARKDRLSASSASQPEESSPASSLGNSSMANSATSCPPCPSKTPKSAKLEWPSRFRTASVRSSMYGRMPWSPERQKRRRLSSPPSRMGCGRGPGDAWDAPGDAPGDAPRDAPMRDPAAVQSSLAFNDVDITDRLGPAPAAGVPIPRLAGSSGSLVGEPPPSFFLSASSSILTTEPGPSTYILFGGSGSRTPSSSCLPLSAPWQVSFVE
mmetsp:Transcript_45548/g.134860  ORF Transcript_45548/g.134860 Transcript_45548/m.134860 type:complete len:242 (+) Transcript_45548:529-1254(+)